jgi:hypothetical protein
LIYWEEVGDMKLMGARFSVDHHWKGEGYQRKN